MNPIMVGKTWQVTYAGGTSIRCETENDAKLLARQLAKKGYRVTAKTLEGEVAKRSIEAHQIISWLVE